jgi:hypothetical protein
LKLTSDAKTKDHSMVDNNTITDPHNVDNPTSDSSKAGKDINAAFNRVTDNLNCDLTNTKEKANDILDTGDTQEVRVDPKVNDDNNKECERVNDNLNGHNAEVDDDLKGHCVEDDLNGHFVEDNDDLIDNRVEVKDDFKDDLNSHVEEVCKSFGDDFVPRKVDIQHTQNADIQEHALNGHYLDDSNDTDSDKNTEEKPFGTLVDDQQLLQEFEDLNVKNESSSSRLGKFM